MSRRNGVRFDEEFKQEAIRLLLTSGRPARQLARELGVSSWTLGQWKKAHLQAAAPLEVAGQVRSAEVVEFENRQLRRELETVRRQRDLLKKAIAICSQDGLNEGRPGGMS